MAKMAKHKHQSEEPAIVTGGGTSTNRFSLNKKTVGIILAVVALLFITGFWVFGGHNDNNSNPPLAREKQATIPSDKQIPDDYSSMTAAEAQEKLQEDTGLNLRKLQKETFTDSTFKTFSSAYEAAQVLAKAGDYQKSYDAYVIADRADGNKNYVFYLNYAAVADYVSKPEVAVQMMSKAKDVISADKSIASADKQSIIDDINQKLHLR